MTMALASVIDFALLSAIWGASFLFMRLAVVDFGPVPTAFVRVGKPDATGIAPGWAVLACLAATVCYAMAASATERYLSGLPPLATAAGSQVGAAVGLALPALWLWPAQVPGSRAWLAALAVGVLCTGIAYILYFRLIEQVGPARALAVTFVLPVFAVIYGALFLREPVTAWMLTCGAVIVLGTALATGLLRLPAWRARSAANP
jgi:drug/metabolite transporter (DMT)-like permease